MSVRVVMGLGNFGVEYDGTRHNVGASLVRRLAAGCGAEFSRNKYCGAYVAKIDLRGRGVVLAFSDSYMNLSGVCLGKILRFYNVACSECAVVHDDISFEVGRVKLSVGGSSGGHNGVEDIMSRCGNEFVRVRVGIGGKPDPRMDLADYVLGRLDEIDAAKIDLVDIGACVGALVSGGVQAAQNLFNRRR